MAPASCRPRLAILGIPLLIAISLLPTFTYAGFCFPSPSLAGLCWPTKLTIDAWTKTLSNETRVLTPADGGDIFNSEATAMNLLKTTLPAMIVIPATEEDLVSAVAFASRYRIRTVTRCSGHDFNGRSSGRNVMLIKTELLKSITYDDADKTITFAAGCNHGDIYTALQPHGRLYVGGQSTTVCPAGCLAGGCHGLLSRQFGLGIDSILEIRFALFNGTILTLSRTSHAPLFHAYLGAGQNAFGVALSFKALTYPAPETLFEVNLHLNLYDIYFNTSGGDPAPNVLSRFFLNTTWWSATPPGASGNLNIRGDGTMDAKLFYIANDTQSGEEALLELAYSNFALGDPEVKEHPSMAALAEANYPPIRDIWQRKFVTNVFVPPDQPTLDQLTGFILATNPYMWLWFLFGGAVPQGTTGSVSRGMRGAMYEVLFGTQWDDPHQDRAQVEGLSAGLPLLYSTFRHSYNNEYTSWANTYNTMPDWKSRFYSNYSSLVAVKKKYDPCNLFTAQHAVASDQPTGTCSYRLRTSGK